MKITKSQLQRIIREAIETSNARDDVEDAIQMLESEEDPNGVLFYVINRLYTALEKM